MNVDSFTSDVLIGLRIVVISCYIVVGVQTFRYSRRRTPDLIFALSFVGLMVGILIVVLPHFFSETSQVPMAGSMLIASVLDLRRWADPRRQALSRAGKGTMELNLPVFEQNAKIFRFLFGQRFADRYMNAMHRAIATDKNGYSDKNGSVT